MFRVTGSINRVCCILLVAYIVVLLTHSLTNIKFINAKQAKGIHLYKIIKRKLYRANAAICYNRQLKQYWFIVPKAVYTVKKCS